MSKMVPVSSPIMEFSLDLFKMLASENQVDNIFMSPLSIAMVLHMVYMGADGNTAEQMSNTLKLQKISREYILHSAVQLMDVLNADIESSGYTLSVANKLYPHINTVILDDFVGDITAGFKTEVEKVDFTNKPEESRQSINNWTQTATRDKIKDLIGPGVITPLTAMVLVNAIYFKGAWRDKFLPGHTKADDFTLKDGSTLSVDMMHKNFDKALYGEDQNLACKVLQLPYKGEQVSMVVILPSSHDGLLKLEQKLTVPILRDLISNVSLEEVDVALPKFKVESSFQLADQLSRLGMPDLFDEAKANLSRMSKEQIHASHVVHKAFVEVNEEGSEAAAATGMVITLMCMVIPMEFKANHPFIYMIWDNRTNLPLFMGRMMKPPA